MPSLLEITNSLMANQASQKKSNRSLLEVTKKLKPSTVKNTNIPQDFLNTALAEQKVTDKQDGKFHQAVDIAAQQAFSKGKSISKWVFNLGKSILQAPQRTLTSVALEVPSAIMSLAQKKEVKPVFTPKSGLERAIFGNEPIKGAFSNLDEWISKGEKVAGDNPYLKGTNLVITPILFGGLKSLDLLPIATPSENLVKNVAKEVAESKSIPMIIKSLGKIFKTEDEKILEKVATGLVDVTDKKVARTFLKDLIKDTKKAGSLDNLLKEVPEAKVLKVDDLPEVFFKDKAMAVAGDAKGFADDVSIDNFAKVKQFAKETGFDAVDLGNISKGKLDIINPDILDTVKSLKGGNDSIEMISKKVVSQLFRGDKLNLPEEQLLNIGDRLKALGLENRTVKTFGDMEQAAKELGTDVNTLLKDVATKRITSDEVVALRNLIKNNSDFIVQANKDLEAGVLKSKEASILEQKIRIAENQMDVALTKLVKGGTEAGRAVASFRILANKTMDPVFWLAKAKKISNSKVLNPEIHDAIIDLIAKKDTIGLAELVASLRNASNTEKAIALMKSGFLSSLTTHEANVGGSMTMRALLDASDVVHTGLDTIVSLVTHKRTNAFNFQLIGARVRGLRKGIKDAAEYLRTGIYTDGFVNKWEIPKMVRFKNKILDGYVQVSFRSLGAEDAVFRGIALQESLEKQALLIAKNEGLRGADAVDRIRQLLVEPTNEMVVTSIDAANYATFQSENILNNMIVSAKRVTKGKPAEFITEATVPFSKTPTNIATRIADFSPLGFIKAMVHFAKPTTRTQKILLEDLSRAITGTGVIAFGGYLFKKGLMMGALPQDKQERDDFLASGKQANSIYLFGEWRQLNRISPFGNLLALGADFEKQSQEKKGLDLLSTTAWGGVKALTEQTFLKGLSSGLNAINDPEVNAKKYFEQSIAGVVPSIVYSIARSTSPTLKDPDGVWQTIQNRIPFMSDNLPSKRDVFGHKVEVSGGRANIIDPFGSKAPVDYPALKEANRLKISIGVPNQSISDDKLTNREFSMYQKLQGGTLEKVLNGIIDSDFYKQASDETKKQMIEKTISAVRTEVNKVVYPRLMAIRYNLPESTNPLVLGEVLKQLNKQEKFKKLSDEQKEGFVKEILTKSNLLQE